ncbi:TPA: hypothetical protein RWN27_003203 [Stenotrophomonas maltophilia]|jgi:hypothetical protein|nr:hypothetical protein [Stenotrophomonas maltophilia]ELF4107396.1 hypothetical protein [Stenotrophomonas maltophilia]MBO1744386.1 hypothetical protein [Stenotrophomonas maltophilia]MCU1176110.1 hypothetical protein [Stenotrophomonas maltophilia]HEA4093604.1 hypothetical protein [Stenotrophomonas maltophilia]HEA4098424.1 hypothetical protein [Stenotrophomonas maltophilia]
MPYSGGTRLPFESASKLGHLAVVQSTWVKELVRDFEQAKAPATDNSGTLWQTIDTQGVLPLRSVWAVDGSFVAVRSEGKPPKEVAFVKTALLLVDRVKIDAIDKENPHPLLLQDVLRGSAIYHSTVFPLKNVRTTLGSNYDAVRHIVRDSFKIDQGGAFFDTLKWLVYKKWSDGTSSSPSFECPHCHTLIGGLPHDADEGTCDHCKQVVFVSDLIGFHLDMDEDSAPDSVASSYMLVMEHLMLFTAIRVAWGHTDKSLVGETLFIKDGPLSLRSQYSKLVPNIREFLSFAVKQGRAVHIIGQEKSGAFVDHLQSIVHFAAPHERGERGSYAALDHNYVRREVYRSPDLSNPYGKRTNWGEKLFLKLDPGMSMVLNVPTGDYIDAGDRPVPQDLIGLKRILATLPSIVSHKFEGALFPVELANGIASMSSYPSAAILAKFLEDQSP